MRHIRPKIYVIPGAGESTRAKNYSGFIQYARNLGLKVIPVNIHWSTKLDMADFINQADNKIPNSIENDYIMGFSLGAYIAAVLSQKKSAKGYIFCSISPYFKDNLKSIPVETKKYWGEKMMNSFKKYQFPLQVNKRAWFLIGKEDWSMAIDTTKRIHTRWLGKKSLHLIEGASHDLSTSNYKKEIEKIIKTL